MSEFNSMLQSTKIEISINIIKLPKTIKQLLENINGRNSYIFPCKYIINFAIIFTLERGSYKVKFLVPKLSLSAPSIY